MNNQLVNILTLTQYKQYVCPLFTILQSLTQQTTITYLTGTIFRNKYANIIICVCHVC